MNFFTFCKRFNFSKEKLNKFQNLYLLNLKIKVLNIAKEKLLVTQEMVPHELILGACQILKIKEVNVSKYLKSIDIFSMLKRNHIKYAFEQAILKIEEESLNDYTS